MRTEEEVEVFSTSVEVFLVYSCEIDVYNCLLHVRGGVSKGALLPQTKSRSSPRPWRCFSLQGYRCRHRAVFSTSVEVFPFRSFSKLRAASLLHVRGGVSGTRGILVPITSSSPRPWRCFWSSTNTSRPARVFSTSVEVFPRGMIDSLGRSGLLHVRGGVSNPSGNKLKERKVFSTSVEVFPRNRTLVPTMCSLLHVHGGVSVKPAIWPMRPLSSPRPWRCLNISVPGVVVVYSRELNGANCS